MDRSDEFVSGMTPRDKIVTAAEAIALIRDGDTVVVEGFAGQCFAEELTLALAVKNLTDRDYALSGTGNVRWLLGAPRTVELTARASF